MYCFWYVLITINLIHIIYLLQNQYFNHSNYIKLGGSNDEKGENENKENEIQKIQETFQKLKKTNKDLYNFIDIYIDESKANEEDKKKYKSQLNLKKI
jgi:hypothetical protein